MLWDNWWVWAAAAVGLAILETLIPGYVFLGFAAGAALVSVLTLIGVSLTLPWMLLIFAMASLVAWIAMRKVFGLKGGTVRRIDHDINEN